MTPSDLSFAAIRFRTRLNHIFCWQPFFRGTPIRAEDVGTFGCTTPMLSAPFNISSSSGIVLMANLILLGLQRFCFVDLSYQWLCLPVSCFLSFNLWRLNGYTWDNSGSPMSMLCARRESFIIRLLITMISSESERLSVSGMGTDRFSGRFGSLAGQGPWFKSLSAFFSTISHLETRC